MTERTPLQTRAKRLYDALCEAQRHASHLYGHTSDGVALGRAARVEGYIEDAFSQLEKLMHEEDCE